MTKQLLTLFCALSTACSAGYSGVNARSAEHASCAGGVVRNQNELERYDGCKIIEGDLVVENVESLAPLAELERVEGGLRIEHTQRLYSLAGLEALTIVRELSLDDNRGLINAGALRALAGAERLHVTGNPRLSRSYGFEQVLLRNGTGLDLSHNAGLRAEGLKEFRPLASATTVAER